MKDFIVRSIMLQSHVAMIKTNQAYGGIRNGRDPRCSLVKSRVSHFDFRDPIAALSPQQRNSALL